MSSLSLVSRACMRSCLRIERPASTLVSKILWKKNYLSVSYSTQPPPQDTNTSSQPITSTENPSNHKLTNKEKIKVQSGRLRTFIRKYGPIGIITYFGMYGITLASIYALVESGVLMATDAISMFKAIHLDKLIDLDSLNPKAGNFAVAWIMTKFTEPIRFALTIAITPSLYRFITGRRSAKTEEDDDEDDVADKLKEKKKDE